MEIEQANSILEEVMEPVVEPVVETKAKKTLSEDRLAKLQKARDRASEVAKERRTKKETAEPVVVIEQSDSDSEDLEGPPGVIFVRRKRSKPKEQNHEMNYLFSSMFGSRSY